MAPSLLTRGILFVNEALSPIIPEVKIPGLASSSALTPVALILVVLGMVSLFSIMDDVFGLVVGVVMSCVRSCGKNKTTRYGDWAIVTGASDGIGEATAKELAAGGHKVVLIARNKAKLEDVKKAIVENGTSPADVMIIVADFSTEATAELYERIANELKPIAGDIGVLVNNVGVSYPGALRFEEFCTERLGGSKCVTEAMVNVNVTSCVKMTGLVLAGMKERRRGAIVFVSSAHGRLPIGAPLYAEYGGCKAFVENFAKSLAVECDGSGVGVQVHFPYFVATKMAKIRNGSIHAPAPKDFARAVVSAIGNGEVKVVPWWFHKIEDYVLLRLPEFVIAPLITNMHDGLRKGYLKKVDKAEKEAKKKAVRPFASRGVVFKAASNLDIDSSTLTEFILKDAAKYGDKLALVDGITGRGIKYNELSTRIGSAAAGLRDLGFGPGKTMAVMLPNCPEYPIAFSAAAVAGGRVTTANPLYTAHELAHQFRDANASLVVTLPMFKETVEAAAADAGCVDTIVTIGEPSGSFLLEDKGIEAVTDASVSPDDCLALPYSSGTTGLPKGTMLSHANLVANIQQITGDPEHNLDMTANDVVLGLLPAFHIYAMTVVFKAALSVGATVVTLPKFEPESFLRTIAEHKVSWAPLVPPLVLFLAKHPVVGTADMSSLRVIFSGAAPLDAETQAAVEARIPSVSVRQGYGMTELSPVSHFTHPKHNVPGSVGFLAPNCEAKLLLPDGKEGEAGDVGELCVRGPNVMLGYLNNEAATRETILPDGFLRTGDIATIDEAGHCYIVDRLKELIKVKGYQVAPAELEGLLLSHSALADAAVIGMPHERDGERPWAFVVRAPTDAGAALTAEDVAGFVAGETVDYKHLDRVEFVDAIPKSASGKILRRELKARALEESAGRA